MHEHSFTSIVYIERISSVYVDLLCSLAFHSFDIFEAQSKRTGSHIGENMYMRVAVHDEVTRFELFDSHFLN